MRDIAIQAKVHIATVSALARGTRVPQVEVLEPLAAALGMNQEQTVDFIIAGLEARPGAPLVKTIQQLRRRR